MQDQEEDQPSQQKRRRKLSKLQIEEEIWGPNQKNLKLALILQHSVKESLTYQMILYVLYTLSLIH